MMSNWSARLRKIAGSFFLLVAVLAIANIETLHSGVWSAGARESHGLVRAQGHLWKPLRSEVLSLAGRNAVFKPLQSELSRSLEQDELNDQNPFAQLVSLAPLQAIMHKGVRHFRRETFRSPSYQEESGYDMISYEIEHEDGSKSCILAYLEKLDPTEVHDIGAPDLRIAFVVFMVSEGTVARHSFYRDGNLIEQSDLTLPEARALVAQRLSNGIPFLSVSR